MGQKQFPIAVSALCFTVNIKATSLPFRIPLRQTKKSKSWEAYHLSGIAKEIAKKNGMTYLFESESNPYYDRKEQRKTSDSEFLSRLCKDAGISLKATDGQIVLFGQSKYEKLDPVLTIQRLDWKYTKYTLSTGAANHQYASCRVRSVDPKTGKRIEGLYTDDEEKTEQRLEITAKVSSIGEAKALAEKQLRLHNKLSRTAKFTLPGDPNLVAELTILLEDWGGWTGKYIIRQAVHSVSASSGYTTQITLRRCLKGY